MTDENNLDFENMSSEQLADYHLKEAAEAARVSLRLNENCEQKFGKKILSDAQITVFQKIAAGNLLTDEEMETLQNEEIASAMRAIREAREQGIKAAESGSAYEPELLFRDETGSAVN